MGNRPLWNGAARIRVDNTPASEALAIRFVFRASIAAIDTGVETVGNGVFRAKAGTAVILNYDIRKYGGGVEAGTPTFAEIAIVPNDAHDSNYPLGGNAEHISADLIGGNVLPRSGTFSFTPARCGTFRIYLRMFKDGADTGATSDDWIVISDGLFQRGGIATINRAVDMDKGRLRIRSKPSVIEVVRQDSTAPPNRPATGLPTFAFKMNAGGTASEESVRATVTLEHPVNQPTPTFGALSDVELRLKQRRNGTSTFDVNVVGAALQALRPTDWRSTTIVAVMNGYPNTGDTVYDLVISCESLSRLHTQNTPQYGGLTGADASGVWFEFENEVGPEGAFVDFQTWAKVSTHRVNPTGVIENAFVKNSDTYSEDANQIPIGVEDFAFIATAENMTVKRGRVLNARAETLFGIFVFGEVRSAAGIVRDSWGNNNPAHKTLANGWEDDAKIVIVSTPPAGVHTVDSVAYFPGTALGAPLNREFSATRTESGSPASASAGKDWVAPASFARAEIMVKSVAKVNSPVAFTVYVFDKDPDGTIVSRDADSLPPCLVLKRAASGDFANPPFATPALTKRAGTVGLYDGQFTPNAVGEYEVLVDATIKSFKRRYGENLEAVSFDVEGHEHTGAVVDGGDGSVAIERPE